MHIRTALVLVASLSLFACSFDAPPPTGSSTANQTKGKTSDASKNANSNDGADDEATGTALDGTWDITVAGPDAIGPSSMTIAGKHVTGEIVMGDGGGTADCELSDDRMSFDLTISGDDLNGTFTAERTYAGSCSGDAVHQVTNLRARRTHDAKNASGATVVEGDWQILSDDGAPAIAVNVAGLVAKAWDNAKKTGSPVMTTNVNGNSAKNTASDATLAFAARKR